MKNGTVRRRRSIAARSPHSSGGRPGPRSPSAPASDITYTNNWPHEPLVGNTPPPHLLMWTVFSVLFLIAGIALLGWHHARHKDEAPLELPASDPLALMRITPSMRATAKYFWLVIALFLTQILLGAITAHYQVEGQEAYGFALSNYPALFADAAPGTRSSRCCGSRPRGWAWACTSGRRFPAMNRSSSASASTSCSPACSSSWWARSPASGWR